MTTEVFPAATSTATCSTASLAAQNNSMYRSKYGEFPKLNHINYSQWHKYIEVALRAEDAFELTQGDEITPQHHQRIQLADFQRRKDKAIALTFESRTTTAQQYHEGFTNPREIWNLLSLSGKLNTAASRAGWMATLNQFSRARMERLGKQRRTIDAREPEPAGVSYATVQALVGQITMTSTRDNWVIDSGPSHHLCRNRHSFSNLKPLRQPVLVRLGDSSTIPATAAGTIYLSLPSRTVSIEPVFVPRLQTSLLSVSQLSTKHQIAFRNSTSFLDDTVLGLLHEGIYCLTIRTHRSAKVTSNHSTASSLKPTSANSAVLPSIDLWHLRLGHLSHQGLGNLLLDTAYTGGPISTLPTCEICVKSKDQRKITREAAQRTTEPFQLIQGDLCGPISPESASGLRYFILYIDDFSRTTWVYFLRCKASVEVVSVFQEFPARMGNSFPNFPITKFRCDNGKGEYDNSLFDGILKVLGISFEPSPPYTQHKNGVSEMMIRNIVTKARAMILDSRLSDEFCAQAVNTAVYLHARSPSRSVDGLTSYEMLFGHKLELGHLRRFGCIAYKLIPDVQRKGKFAEQAKRCGFFWLRP